MKEYSLPRDPVGPVNKVTKKNLNLNGRMPVQKHASNFSKYQSIGNPTWFLVPDGSDDITCVEK